MLGLTKDACEGFCGRFTFCVSVSVRLEYVVKFLDIPVLTFMAEKEMSLCGASNSQLVKITDGVYLCHSGMITISVSHS